MDNSLIDRRLPENQSIFNIPLNSSRIPSVPNPVDHQKLNLASKPDHKTEMDLQLCNTLPPAPRSQLVNYPPDNSMCPNENPLPYIKDTCYLVNSKVQGVVGLVCNGPGQSGNANFYRGNQFSNDYEWINQYAYEDNKKLEYTDEFPVKTNDQEIVYKRPYTYPSGEFIRSQYPQYRTYPYFNNYTVNGYPIYTYPYTNVNNTNNTNNVVEGFENTVSNSMNRIILSILVVLVLILFVYYLKKY
jgi:hypothetical protein